jgi:dCMP deaminase
MMCRPSWDSYGLSLAHMAALRSEDPFCKVGAVALRKDKSLVATGYNGAPPGVALDWSDRDARRPYVCHAEVNCLKYAKPDEVDTLYITLSPCMSCLTVIASYNIKRVVYSKTYDKSIESFEAAKKFGITLEHQPFELSEYIYKYTKPDSIIEEMCMQKQQT